MSKVHRLPTLAERGSRKAARYVLHQQLLLPMQVLDELPPDVQRARSRYMREARRASRDEQERVFAGGFNMISRKEYLHVCRELAKLPANQHRRAAERVWMFLVALIEEDNAEVLWDREDFARELGILPRHISSAMTTLERLGAVRRERDGRTVTYYVNANVAWNGDPERHKIEAAKSKPPSLHVVEGGAA